MKTLIKTAIRLVIAFMIYDVLLRVYEISAGVIYAVGYSPWYYWATILMMYLVLLIVLALTWIKTDRIVRFVAGPIRGNEITIDTSNIDLLTVALSIFGVYLIVNALGDLAYMYSYQWQLRVSTPRGVTPSDSAWETGKLVMDILRILIGTGFIMGKNGIKRTWKWFNDIGKPPIEPEETPSQFQ